MRQFVRYSSNNTIFASSEAAQNGSVVNDKKTGVSYYDDFLTESGREYMKKHKNRVGHVVQMSPSEYYETCAKDVFNTTVDRLKEQRSADDDSILNLQEILYEGGQFWLPYINLADKNQEGLHRMMVLGDSFGWDTKFPVLIVESADARVDEINEAYRQLNRAQSNASEYLYRANHLPEDFIVQTQYELERYDDETGYKAVLDESTEDGFTITLKGFEDDFNIQKWYANMRIKDTEDEEDDFDFDNELDENDLQNSIESLFFK